MSATPKASGKLTRRAKIHYDIHGRPFPLPVVTGTIAGHSVLMLVDTGANSHVVAGWLARKLALPMKKLGDVGTDHVGNSIATYRLDDVETTIDGWGKLSTTTLLATEVPAVIEKLGIGAFISPQRLDEEGDAVIFDLAKGELRSARWDEAQGELRDSGAPLVAAGQGKVCEDTSGPVKGLAFVIPAEIEAQRADRLLDTGAQHTDLFASSPAGQKLAGQSTTNREQIYTASGKVSAHRLKGARVRAGSFAVTTDINLIQGAADSACPRDGVLAMDILRSCTLLFGPAEVYARCLTRPR